MSQSAINTLLVATKAIYRFKDRFYWASQSQVKVLKAALSIKTKCQKRDDKITYPQLTPALLTDTRTISLLPLT
jgi:hypothetical protein